MPAMNKWAMYFHTFQQIKTKTTEIKRKQSYRNMFGSQQSCPYKARTLLCAQHKRFNRQRFHIVFKLAAQIFTFAGIINQNDFFEQRPWRSIYYTPNGTQQRWPCLIVEHNDNGCAGQLGWIMLQFAVGISDIGKRSIQWNHITSHQIELILFEFLFHYCLLLFRYVDRFTCVNWMEMEMQLTLVNWIKFIQNELNYPFHRAGHRHLERLGLIATFLIQCYDMYVERWSPNHYLNCCLYLFRYCLQLDHRHRPMRLALLIAVAKSIKPNGIGGETQTKPISISNVILYAQTPINLFGLRVLFVNGGCLFVCFFFLTFSHYTIHTQWVL